MSIKLIKDTFWVGLSQLISVLLQLAGLRILTEKLSPAIFGQVSLIVGLISLLATSLAGPSMQAFLIFYPKYSKNKKDWVVFYLSTLQIKRLYLFSTPIVFLICIFCYKQNWIDIKTIFFIIILELLEINKIVNTSVLNVTNNHKMNSIYSLIDTCSRPFLAVLMVIYFKFSDVNLVLLAYILSSCISWIFVQKFLPKMQHVNISNKQKSFFMKNYWKYCIPLFPLGIVSWFSGMSDRYLIGYIMTPSDVGLYVAIYGLASRPMLLFGSILETTFRPMYYSHIVNNNSTFAKKYLILWVLLTFFGSLILFFIGYRYHELIAEIFLAESYRSFSFLIPWFILGYFFYLLYQISGRILYAHGETFQVLISEASGGILAIFSGFLLIHDYGIIGATLSIPIYYCLQFIISVYFSRKYISS